MPRNTDRVLTANVASQSSTSISVSGPNAPPMPALLNITSSRPNDSTASATSASTSGSIDDVGRHEPHPIGDSVGLGGGEQRGPAVGVEVADDRTRTLGEEALDRGEPHPTRATGDDGNAPCEPIGHRLVRSRAGGRAPRRTSMNSSIMS